MNLQPYTCKCCGGKINVAIMRCEYCDTEYQDDSLKPVKFSVVRPGVHKISATVRIDGHDMLRGPEFATNYALSELKRQFADGLLAFMKVTSEIHPGEHAEYIRGEVRVLDPTFDTY